MTILGGGGSTQRTGKLTGRGRGGGLFQIFVTTKAGKSPS